MWFFWTLPVLLQRWCSTCLVCLHTHWHQGKAEKGQSPEYSKIFGKNTIFNEHPVFTYGCDKHLQKFTFSGRISLSSYVNTSFNLKKSNNRKETQCGLISHHLEPRSLSFICVLISKKRCQKMNYCRSSLHLEVIFFYLVCNQPKCFCFQIELILYILYS